MCCEVSTTADIGLSCSFAAWITAEDGMEPTQIGGCVFWLMAYAVQKNSCS